MLSFDIKFVTKTFNQNFADLSRQFQEKNISPVEIDIEQLRLLTGKHAKILMERPVAVRGIVLPTHTKGRKPAPNPIAFQSLSKYIKSVNHQKQFQLISPCSDRGHVFALQLGGNNSNYNIIPQWNSFQRHGDWRRLERSFFNHASVLIENNNTIFLEVNIEYLNLNMQHLQNIYTQIFDFTSEHHNSEARATHCLQIFGIPTSYSFNTYPCSIYIKKPRKHSLSIAYIKYLYELSQYIAATYKNSKPTPIKIAAAQERLGFKWGKDCKIAPISLIRLNESLQENFIKYCQQGRFVLSTITEEDVLSSLL